jgi:hydroxymethylpyrimidine pyrophosphatase-like HAD family hydrolase
VRCLYADLDGTLLGRGASLMHDGEGVPTMLGVRAMEACLRAGVEVVLMSGRRRAQVSEPARLLGQRSYAFEIGSGLVLDGELLWLTDGMLPDDEHGTIHDQVAAAGAPALLLERFAGRLEEHDPWNTGREVTHVFRGDVDAAIADLILGEHGFEHLKLVDNGVLGATSATLDADVGPLHGYHLLPRGTSKAGAVAAHMRARGYAPDDVVGVGDSREDLGAAAVVGTFWLVANALVHDATLEDAIRGLGNVRVAEESNGAGVYEAVVTELAERR